MSRVHKSRCSFLTSGRIVAVKLHEKEEERKYVADEALEVARELEELVSAECNEIQLPTCILLVFGLTRLNEDLKINFAVGQES